MSWHDSTMSPAGIDVDDDEDDDDEDMGVWQGVAMDSLKYR
jgi:hypothetical protein